MWKISSPDGVVVSMAPSQTDRKPTPNSLRRSIKVTKWRTERPSRSSRHTSKMSPGRSCLKHVSSPARSCDAPDALSVKISSLATPHFSKASSWRSRSWLPVLTRAYPTRRASEVDGIIALPPVAEPTWRVSYRQDQQARCGNRAAVNGTSLEVSEEWVV